MDIGGALFGSVGRVFMSSSELKNDFGLDQASASHLTDTVQYDYGLGLRFAVARAILARVDVGFSEEETGLVYLSFGHTFLAAFDPVQRLVAHACLVDPPPEAPARPSAPG